MKLYLYYRSAAFIAVFSSWNVNAFTVTPATEAILVATPTRPFHLDETRISHFPSQPELAWLSSTSLLSEAAAATPTTPLAITNLQYDGKVPTTESDEYVVFTNRSKSPVDVSGYVIYVASNGTQGATFAFPSNAVIAPGASVRVYTNEIHKESGGYSFHSQKAIWNNKGGLAVWKDASGKKLGEYKYKPPQTG